MLRPEVEERDRNICVFFDGHQEVIEWYWVPDRSVVGPFRDPIIVFKTESGIYKYEKTEYEPYEVLPRPKVVTIAAYDYFTKLCRDYGYIDVKNKDIWYTGTNIERIVLYDPNRE